MDLKLYAAIAQSIKKITKNQKDLNPAFSKAVDEHFWELV